MKIPRLHPSLAVAAAFAVAFLAAARAEEAPTIIKFSKPEAPGTVKIILAHGDLRVTAADTNEVSVRSDSKTVNRKAPRKDGLRELASSSSYALSEKDNVVTLDTMADGWAGGGSSDFRLTVPRSTSLIVQNAWGGDITTTGLGGDIEIKSTNGEIHLNDVAGGVVVDTMNGEISAGIRELHDGKPLSFTSTNGEVVIRVPTDAKANVRLRTQNGIVLTDFDDKVLVTKTETTTHQATGPRGKGRIGALPPEARLAINEASKTLAQVGREVKDAFRDGIDAARADTERARNDMERARVDIERSKRDMERARVEAERQGMPAPAAAPAAPASPATPVAAAAPKPPAPPAYPTITGGKLVTGTLNGGGPEISVASMNGDVTLRQLDKK